MEVLETIDAVVGKRAPGVPPSYTGAHVLITLENISSSGSIGRQRLSRILRIGEGATRTLVKRLSMEGLIKVSRGGITLTEKGRELFSELRKKISKEVDVPKSRVTLGSSNVAILVSGLASAVRKGIEQRDAAIKAGALGATTLTYDGNKLIIPSVEEEEFRRDPIYDALISKLKPKNGDVIVIGSAEDEHSASLGAKMAALELLRAAEQTRGLL
ncbi:MAG: DUF4443 domain-containing protein [Candidatus Bathyarchaeia archaeon]